MGEGFGCITVSGQTLMILRPKPVQYPFVVLLDVTLSRLFCIALIVTKTGEVTERKDIVVKVVKIIRPKLSWDQ